MEAVQVHRRRARRQGRRRRRARAGSACWSPSGCPAFGVQPHRLRPLRPGRPRRPDRRRAWSPSTSCSRESDFITVHLPKTPETLGPDRRRGAAQGQADACASSTPPAAASSTRRRWPRRSRTAGSPAPASTSTPRSRAPTRPLFALRPGRRHPAPGRLAPTRRRRRPASRSRAPYGSRWPASSCRTRSTCRAASIAEDVTPGPAAGREARPDLHRPRRRAAPPASTSRSAARSPQHDVSRARAGRAQGRLHRRRRGAGLLRQRARCSPRSAASRSRCITSGDSPDHRNLVTVRGTHGRRRQSSRCPARSSARKQIEKLVEVDGFDVDLRAHRPHGLLPLRRPARRRRRRRPHPRRRRHQHRRHAGQPRRAGGHALMALTVDSAVPAADVAGIVAADRSARLRPGRRPGRLTAWPTATARR